MSRQTATNEPPWHRDRHDLGSLRLIGIDPRALLGRAEIMSESDETQQWVDAAETVRVVRMQE